MIDIFSQIQNLYWREPLWLLISLYPVVVLIFKSFISKRNISRFVENDLQAWVVVPNTVTSADYLFSKNTLYIAAWILFSAALSGPRVPINQPDTEHYVSSNIMIVIDTSLSMQANDIAPNRIHRVKLEVYELLDKVQNQRIGITVFSARPHLYVPLTSDYNALRLYLENLDQLSLPTSGSDPVAAILSAQKELSKINGKSSILLITDGESELFSSQKNLSALDVLKTSDIPLYILGAGTVEGSAIALADGSWLMHNNKPVISRMNELLLQTLAKEHNGKYSPILENNNDWQTLYDEGMARHKTLIHTDKNEDVAWHELYHFFLLPSVLFFIFALTPLRLHFLKNKTAIFIAVVLVNFVPDKNARAFSIISNDEQKAYTAYHAKNYKQAIELYTGIKGYNGYMGVAASLYKMGDYQASVQPFTLAVLAANTDNQRQSALYNLGNSYLHNGKFSLAIKMYEDVLRYQPNHLASKHNLKLSETLQNTLIQQQAQQTQRISPRQGQGPRSAQLPDNTEVSNNTSVSPGDNKNKANQDIPLPDLPDINDEVLKSLLQLGLKNIQLAGEDNKIESGLNHVSTQDMSLVELHMQSINDEQALIWKRLFEIEEGFPAPLDNAKTVPGVNPW